MVMLFVISGGIVGLLVGMLLGLRFKVFVLVPFILIAACATIATGHGVKAIALAILATAMLLQIGYILGLVVRVWAAPYLWRRRISRSQLSKSKSNPFRVVT
jgi:predicted membrane channel-forming protein YqfA (hemolysin III family)